MAKKEKQKSFLTQQREKLKAQKAAKQARGTGAKNARIIREGVARMATGTIPKTRGQVSREKRLTGRSARARKERLERSKPENQPGARRREAAKRQATAKANLAKAKPAVKAPKPNFKAALAAKLKNLAPAAKKLAMRGAMLLSGDGSGQALILAKSTSDLIDVARGSTAEQRNASKKPEPKTPATAKRNTTGRQGGSRAAVNRKPTKTEPKPTVLKRNRRGRPTKVEAPKLTKPRGLSNIPKSEGSGGKAETTLKYGAGKPKVKPIPKTKPAGKVPSTTPKTKPIPKSTPKSRAYAADSRNKEYDRLRKAGKLKEAAALGKKIYSDKFGKKDKKKKPQSRALRAGYPGNQNY